MNRPASRSLLVAVALVALPLSAASADPIGPTPATYVVVGNEVIDGGVHVWDFPVVVTPGSSLTIRNATVYLDWRSDVCTHGTAGVCPTGFRVDGGTLRIHDSTIDTHYWKETDGYSGYKITGTAATFDFQRSRFLHQQSFGTQFAGPERSLIKDNVFDQVTTGMTFWRGAEVDIIGNVISHALYGVELRDTTGVVRGNTFRDIYRSWGSSRALTVQSTQVGQRLYVTDPIVEDNLFENGPRALAILSLNGFPNVFRNNVIRGFEAGSSVGLLAGDHARKEHPIWVGNVFDGNELQMQVYGSGTTDDGVEEIDFRIAGNSFIGDSCTDLSRRTENPYVDLAIDARGNWWGQPDGPRPDREAGCPRFLGGGIIWNDWLTAAP